LKYFSLQFFRILIHNLLLLLLMLLLLSIQ
jgi:hypothetical protein